MYKDCNSVIYNYICVMKKYLSLIKFSHTVFALPFALIGYFIAVQETNFDPILLLKVLVCMVLARSSAMAFNRIVDRKFDKQNPRTASREIPSGVVSLRSAMVFLIISVVGFVAVTATINMLCLALSPVALLVILGYSYTKRFTALCHLILGLGLAIAPTAAYIAVTGTFAVLPILFSCLVFTWVSGFDIIFALQDVEFDKSARLHSIPAMLGLHNALIVSALLHLVTAFFVVLIGTLYLPSVIYIAGSVIFIAMLVYQHTIVCPSDLSRVNIAFGTTNGIASVVFATFTIISLFV